MLAVRAGLVVLAVLAGGWLAVQERAAHAEGQLDALAFDDVQGRFGPERLGAGENLLRVDRRLNPDHRPDLYHAVILGRAGLGPRAVRVLRAVVAAEPENVEAWALLAQAADRLPDPRLAARARGRLRVLAPPVPGG